MIKCPQCREECVSIEQIREAAISRDLPHGKPKIVGFRGPVLRYECKCLRCQHSWKPRSQFAAGKVFEAE